MCPKSHGPASRAADCPQGGPAEQLDKVREFFRARGLLGKKLNLQVGGQTYRLVCDDRALAVFRVNERKGLPPGNPGWMVCRLDRDSLFEECASPGLNQCQLACPHTLRDWLELVEKEFS